MDDNQPAALIELQEKVAEIFWFVKGQAHLAGDNLSAQPQSSTGDLDETEQKRKYLRMFANVHRPAFPLLR